MADLSSGDLEALSRFLEAASAQRIAELARQRRKVQPLVARVDVLAYSGATTVLEDTGSWIVAVPVPTLRQLEQKLLAGLESVKARDLARREKRERARARRYGR